MRKVTPTFTIAIVLAFTMMERVLAQQLDPRTVFVTSETTTNGDLKTAGGGADGLEGGDNLCQAAADSPNSIVPAGTYKSLTMLTEFPDCQEGDPGQFDLAGEDSVNIVKDCN